ncbi:MAG: hypothetical protein P9M01_00240 [Candidatus Kappaea frigidicola]|nr:hypothetical protein [Candidatus Kappaea frigidicola]
MDKRRAVNKLLLCAFVVISICIFFIISVGDSGVFLSNRIPQPKIFYPRSENVDIAQKDSLEFKWSSLVGSSTDRRYYDFRLYKGYDITTDNLIYKKEVSPFKSKWNVEANLFQNGQVYTWTLRQVYISGKSDRSINSFKIHK